jgi:hypothetical protein
VAFDVGVDPRREHVDPSGEFGPQVVETRLETLEAGVDLREAGVDLREAGVDLREAGVDLLEAGSQRLELPLANQASRTPAVPTTSAFTTVPARSNRFLGPSRGRRPTVTAA